MSEKVKGTTRNSRGEDALINKNFGDYVKGLLEKARKSQRAFADSSEVRYQDINKIIKGELRATPEKIEKLASNLGIDEEILRVIAGRPSLNFIRSFQKSPHEFIHKIMGDIETYKIAIAEVLLGAHIFWIPNAQLSSGRENICKFEVQTYETGREALKELIADKVQFATVTEAVLKYGGVKEEEYIKVLFFTVPQRGDFYSVYTLPLRRKNLRLAYLVGTASQRASTKFKTSRYTIKKIPKNSVEEIAQALHNNEIDGFFGWSPLHYKVNSQLSKLSGEMNIEVIKSPELKLAPSFDQRLYLVAKEEYLRTHPFVLRELIQSIIIAREELNHILERSNRIDIIKSVLVMHIPYLKNFQIEDELRNLLFDSNIKSDAFKYLFKP
jgi:plasmid maintenance system antidote protein VapI